MIQFWKLGDSLGEVVAKYNCKEYDRVRKILKTRCLNCDYVCSMDPKKSFAIAGMDPVCELCHDMYKALAFNPGMRNMNYFREIKEAEEKKKKDDGRQFGGWRDRAGL